MDKSNNHHDKFLTDFANKMDEVEPNLAFQYTDWDRIESLLPKAEKKKRPFGLIWFILLLFCILIGVAVHNKQSKVTEPTLPKETPNNVVSLDKEVPIIINSTKNEIGRPQVIGAQEIENRTPKKAKNVKVKFSSVASQFKLNLSNVHTLENYDEINNSFINKYANHSTNISNEQKEQKNNFSNLIDPLPLLNSRLSNSLNLFNIKKVNYPMQQNKNVQWIGRLSYGKYFEKNHIGNDYTTYPNSITESIITANNGQQLGIFLLAQKNKNWRLGLGMYYTTREFETLHKANINTDDIAYQSTNADNIKKYTYEYNLFDGSVASRVRLLLSEVSPNQNFGHSDTFNVNMTFQRKVTNFDIPFYVERRLLTRNNFSVFIKTGVSLAVSSNVSNSIKHHSETCKELYFSNGNDLEITSSPTKDFRISGKIGASLEYNLSPQFSLGFNPDIIIHPNHNNTSWLHQQSVGMYLSYKLNK